MTAPSTYANTLPCGTPGAAGRHRYYEEPLCDECRKAEAKRMREQRRGLRPKRNPPRHGTISGYRHLHHGEKACGPCAEAMAEYNREHRRNGPRGRRKEPSTREMIVDMLETWDYPMSTAVLVSKIQDVKPWKGSAISRMVERMLADGELVRFERLGEWLIRLP